MSPQPRPATLRRTAALAAALLTTACLDGLAPTAPGGFAGDAPVLTYQATYAGPSGHSCLLSHGSRARCWGTNSGGALGDGSTRSRDQPGRVEGTHLFAHLALGPHTCGVTTNGFVFCWGGNLNGRLGDGTLQGRRIPTRVETDVMFSTVTLGSLHSCALALDATVYCWGDNQNGQLAGVEGGLSMVPVRVAAGLRLGAIEAAGHVTCGLDDEGSLLCWGGPWGATPRPLSGAPPFERFSIGDEHGCGLTAGGEAWCWGANEEGRLGTGSTEPTPFDGPPVRVATELRFRDISAGFAHTCAIATDGRGYCWGHDHVGQLGDGEADGPDDVSSTVPSLLRTDRFWESISAGRFLSCGVTDRFEAFCWGFGTGNPAATNSDRPVQL